MTKSIIPRFFLGLFLALFVVGQIAFYFYSPRYLSPIYESRLFTTTGIQFDEGKDLHWLNESAHYFSETVIGWSRFPNFQQDLIAFASLPADSELLIFKQERQNMVTSIRSSASVTNEQMQQVRSFLQSKIDEYNLAAGTTYELIGEDVDHQVHQNSYAAGALMATALALVFTLLVWFLAKEFKV